MAKKKKDRKKKPQYPPLSLLDKSIYIGLFVLSIALLVIATYVILGYLPRLGLRDVDVMVSHKGASILWAIPFFLYWILTGGLIFELLNVSKKPIFGNPKIQYESSEWKRTYPIFDKRYRRKPCHKRAVKDRLAFCGIWLAGMLLVLGLAFFSVFGRADFLYDGSVRVYNVWNQEKEVYAVSDIVDVKLKTGKSGGGRYSSGHWTVFSVFTLSDGKEYAFTISDFRSKGEFFDGMTMFKTLLGDDRVTIEGKDKLENVIEDGRHFGGYSDEQKACLYELFE